MPCECDAVGSASQFCDPISGQCACKYGVTGRKCGECRENFYGFSKFGCFGNISFSNFFYKSSKRLFIFPFFPSECEPCNKLGHICNRNNGRCVCPTLTEGVHCERCAAGAWNYSLEAGCQVGIFAFNKITKPSSR